MNLARCGHLARTPLTGVWYRAIDQSHLATSLSTAHTTTIPSRFSSGSGNFEILYLCENPQVAQFEVEAMFGTPLNIVPNPRGSGLY
jgi:hypothetical protein